MDVSDAFLNYFLHSRWWEIKLESGSLRWWSLSPWTLVPEVRVRRLGLVGANIEIRTLAIEMTVGSSSMKSAHRATSIVVQLSLNYCIDSLLIFILCLLPSLYGLIDLLDHLLWPFSLLDKLLLLVWNHLLCLVVILDNLWNHSLPRILGQFLHSILLGNANHSPLTWFGGDLPLNFLDFKMFRHLWSSIRILRAISLWSHALSTWSAILADAWQRTIVLSSWDSWLDCSLIELSILATSLG